MKRRRNHKGSIFSLILNSMVILAMLSSLSSHQSVLAQNGDGLKRQVNAESHKVSFIGPENGARLSASQVLGTSFRPQNPGMALAKHFAPEFGLRNPERDLSVMKNHREADGRLMVRYQQKYQGIPVMGGELIVNTNDAGDLYSMNGEVSPNLSLSIQPTIDSAQAQAIALQSMAKWYQGQASDFVATEPALWIFDESLLRPSTRPAELVWRMEVTAKDNGMPMRELVLVNAQRGGISLHFNQIDTAWHGSTTGSNDTPPDVSPTVPPATTETPLPPGDVLVSDEMPVATAVPLENAVATDTSVVDSPEVATATTWYVATTGSDGNSCTSAGSPCATINGAIGKPTVASGDTIKVAIGTYTGSGTEVVLINKSVTLSGGWNANFTVQSGTSVIDGQGARRGIKIGIVTTTIDHFTIQNGFQNAYNSGGGGIFNDQGTVTLNNSVVRSSVSNGDFTGGGGISNNGTMVLNSTTITGNSADGYQSGGAGIYNLGTLLLNKSSVSSNRAGANSGGGNPGGGIYNYAYSGMVTVNNSTISKNMAGGGAGIENQGTLSINSSTITRNSAISGGGLAGSSGTITIKNSIVAGNTGNWPDCVFPPTTEGYNIIGEATSCNFTPTTGDLINVDPKLGQLIGSPAYIPLSSDSPAINAGNPAGCMGSSGVLTTDQRGAARVGRCDIGAYEYTTPGTVTSLSVADGNAQSAAPTRPFTKPLQVAALDSIGSPVVGVNVTFTAPGSGASGIFADTSTNTTSAMSDKYGLATASTLTANNQFGAYTVSASASGAGSVSFSLLNTVWYVATTGNDSNTCTTAGSPCATINGVIAKASDGDAAYVGAGTYTGSGTDVVLVNKSIKLYGGWNAGFTTQSGMSIVDGQSSRRGMTVNYFTTCTLERFIIQNGYAVGNAGGGIYNNGTLSLNFSAIKGNIAGTDGGGILNLGTLNINNSSITGNTGSGAGIANGASWTSIPTTAVIKNSTISNNNGGNGSGIENAPSGTLYLSNVTVSGNISYSSFSGGIHNNGAGLVVLENTIVAGNVEEGTASDCYGSITSNGHNLIGNNSSCTFTSKPSDLIGTSLDPIKPRLAPLQDNGGPTFTRALMVGSPAIDAGNPATCLSTDQRGVARPVAANCDIGAFEGSLPYVPTPWVQTYTANNSSMLPGLFLCNENQQPCTANNANSHADAAHKYAIGVFNFYLTKFGRDSIDNNGLLIASTVHYCDPTEPCPLDNALWTGTQMVYGDAHAYALADDLVGHELTHGVTQYESNLFYYYQSGAINESLSDVFGEYYDQVGNVTAEDTAGLKWRVGEDISDLTNPAPFPPKGLRDMKDPTLFLDPDKMSSPYYFEDADDSGGVHFNSGVNNKAVFLMVDGGTFNTKTVTGLGWDKVGAIYYEANTNLLTSGADYSDLYYALQQACANLIGQKGITGGDCTEVKDAIDAVEMNGQPAPNFNTDAPYCDAAGTVPNSFFADDLETGTSNWTFENGNQVRWQYDSPQGPYVQSGDHSLYADDSPQNDAVPTDARATLAAFVVPSNAYLYFAQAYDFETGYLQNDPTLYNFDGGVLEYSINNGSSWVDAGSLMQYNGYKGNVFGNFGNPLAGRSGFVGASHGYIGTRLNLASLAGNTVKFRWRMGLDGDVFAEGWWVDNVQAYTCGTIATISGNAGAAGVTLTYFDGVTKSVVSQANGNYSFQVNLGWTGTVTPSNACYTFNPPSRSYSNLATNKVKENYIPIPFSTANVDVQIGGAAKGSYVLPPGDSTRQNYAGLDSGPVRVTSTNCVPIVSALRDLWWNGNEYTSSIQLMGLPQNLLSDTYVFPSYNNVSLNDQLRFGNVGNADTVVTVTIGGQVMGTYPLAPNQRQKVNYAGLDSGPVIVHSSGGVPIIASIRDAWIVNGTTTSFSQLMGLPQSLLSDTYYFPSYNNVSLSDQLRFGNVGNAPTTITVTIGGVVRGTYDLLPNQRGKDSYVGLDSGPVIVKSSNGVPIIASLREAWLNNGVTTSYFQMMGLPQSQLSDKYVFPAYDNVSLSGQLRFGNVGNAPTTVTVTIAGVVKGSYDLAPNQRQKVSYAGLDDGPVVIQSSNNVPIIAALRDAWLVNGVTNSFSQLMGLPGGQLSTTYVFPSYNNATYDNQLRIGVP